MSSTEQQLPAGFTIDASIAVKLFIQDDLSERVQSLFNLLVTKPGLSFHVPDLFFIECANVLYKYIRSGGMDLATAQANLFDLSQLGLHTTSTADLMVASLEVASEYAISAYDACYVVLARQLDLPLVTADEKLAARFPGTVWLDWLPLESN